MKTLAAALLALAFVACGDAADDHDAGPDAFVPDADLDAPDAAPQLDGLYGTWHLTWTCLDNCGAGAVAPLRYDDLLEVGGDGTLHFHSTTCSDVSCAADHYATISGDCAIVAAGEDFTVARSAYELCLIGAGAIRGEMSWSGYPGPPAPRTWEVRGAR